MSVGVCVVGGKDECSVCRGDVGWSAFVLQLVSFPLHHLTLCLFTPNACRKWYERACSLNLGSEQQEVVEVRHARRTDFS